MRGTGRWRHDDRPARRRGDRIRVRGRAAVGVSRGGSISSSGGLSQLDSFDMKPDAPAEIRGEFRPIRRNAPAFGSCEHLPMLAQRSQHWSLVRSLSHPTNGHSEGHAIMLTGRTPLPPGFNGNSPTPADWPSIAAIAGQATQRRGILPASAVLPRKDRSHVRSTFPGNSRPNGARPRALVHRSLSFATRLRGVSSICLHHGARTPYVRDRCSLTIPI